MTSREILRKIQSWEEGRPVPKYSTLANRINPRNESLGIVFLRMAGETRPWSVMIGKLDESPKFFFASEPRNREIVNSMIDEVSAIAIHYIDQWALNHSPNSVPQFWFPDDSHVDMLHNVEYAYSRERDQSDFRTSRSNFGRLAGWLFRENQHRGQQCVLICNQLLMDSWTFPVEEVRERHLGHALSWFSSKSDFTESMNAANDALELRVGITLNPDVEKKFLEKHVQKLRDGSLSEIEFAKKNIRKILLTESKRRWNLMIETQKLLASDLRPENSGVKKLVATTSQRINHNYLRIEQGVRDEVSGAPAIVPHPETDRDPAAAAAAYIEMTTAEQSWLDILVDDDSERLQEMIDSGDAFSGTITHVKRVSSNSQAGWWLVQVTSNGSLRLKEHDNVRLIGQFEKSGEIEDIEIKDDGTIEILLRITKGILGIPGQVKPLSNAVCEQAWIGTDVSFAPLPFTGQMRKIQRIWESKNSPGSWLAHSKPSREDPEPTPNDISQIDQND